MEHLFRTPTDPQFHCSVCGFELWVPIGELRHSYLGLYDDDRFPGRCILALKDHHDDFPNVPRSLASSFILEAQDTARAIKRVTGSPRINLALLGNAEHHVHFHLIPRFPGSETFPERSPWDDPRPKQALPSKQRDLLVSRLSDALTELLSDSE